MKAILAALLAALALAGCHGSSERGASGGELPPRFAAELSRTSHGVVHVKAADFAGIGYGLAFAFAQDNICMLADSLLTVRGERSRYFGPDAHATAPRNGEYGAALDFIDLRNEDSDFFFKAYLDLEQLRAGYAAGAPEIRQLLAGYAAGYNRYLRDNATRLPMACHDAPWVKPISVDDLYLMVAEKALHGSGEVFAASIVAAAQDLGNQSALPPAPRLAAPAASTPMPTAALPAPDLKASNALAVGRDYSANGAGMLLANPHYPWTSTDRFYQVHLTVPGQYDVMGVSLAGLPIVVIGFNKDVAWTHTVSKSVHFTTFALKPMADDTSHRQYQIDGVTQALVARTATIDVLQPDGRVLQKRKAFYFSQYGAVMAAPGGQLMVLGDANRNNTRLLQQWLAMGKADSVQSLKTQLDRIVGLPWINTVAADRYGQVLYADASVVPHVLPEQFASDCLLQADLLTFDGSRSACTWGSDGDAPPGIFGASHAPSMLRTDYVANSNDSYWLTNARQLLTGPPPSGFSPLYGPIDVAQHLRTRAGFIQIEEMLARKSRLVLDDLQTLVFADRIYAAELILPELLPACLGTSDVLLAQACSVLAAWDRKANLDSRGAVLFREFWNSAALLPNKWALPFDATDPLHTPRGIAPAALPAMLESLRAAALKLQGLGVPLDGRLGDYQGETRNGVRVPIHGAIGDIDGSYNSIHMASPLESTGYNNVAWGSSYIQLVTFVPEGPVARGLLIYGQSTDPRSPYYADQLPLYSNKEIPTLPFSANAITADPAFQWLVLSEP
jgi:acyl-homoserine-lactone acylase